MTNNTKIDFTILKKLVNPIYYPHLKNDCRYNIFFGGSGSGKSFFCAQRIIYRIVKYKKRNFLILRKVDLTNRDSTFAQIKQVINTFGLTDLFTVNKSDMKITFNYNGNQIIFKGLDDPEKIKSITAENGNITDIWIEEATELAPDDLKLISLRLRGKTKIKKQITLTFNPISSLHWIKQLFFDKPIDSENCFILKTTYLDNNFLADEDKKEIEKLKDTDPMYYQIYGLGEWGIIGNIIFSNFVIENFNYQENDFDAIYCGMDFGVNHPSAIEKIGIKDGELYAYQELYVRGLTNSELIQHNEAYNILLKNQYCRADSAEPARIMEWQQKGYKVFATKKGKDSVKAGIDFLRSKKIHIHQKNCPGLAAEFGTYKWREDKNGNVFDEPVPLKDDGIAALRYAIEELWQQGTIVQSNISAADLGL